MPLYHYHARSVTGELIKGSIKANSKDEVVNKLRDQKLFITSVETDQVKTFNFKILRKVKIPTRDIAVFCRQFSTMLNAGLPLLTALIILKQQTENKKMSQIVEQVALAVQGGDTLSNAFGMHKEIQELMITMIEAGEVGGILDQVLVRLAIHLEKEHVMNEKVKSALTYPIVVLCVAFIAIIILLTFVLPSFKKILADLGVPMPFSTRLILGVSDFLADYWYIVMLFLGCVGYAGKRFFITEQGKEFKDKSVLRLPIFGPLNQKVIISRFARTLGTLLKGGVPILTSLEVVKRTANNKIVAEGIERAQINIRDGGGMSGPLAESGVFPPMVTQMIAIGEETGTLDSLLEKISDFYDSEVDNMVTRLASMLEPLMILVLGGIIGIIILSILFPMFKVIGSI